MGQEQAIIRAAQIPPPRSTAEKVEQRGWLRRGGIIPLVALVIVAAWVVRNGKIYESGDNFGYYIGVVGGLMILTLLLYPLRKHFRFMNKLGATKSWFRLHMIFGITGPTLILFHSTFRFGSVNALVALSCMLLVASSGIVGRVFYRKIHHGLYGRSATLQEVQTKLGIVGGDVKSKFHFSPNIEQRMKKFETYTLSKHEGVWERIWQFVTVGMRARWNYFAISRELDRFGRHYASKHGLDADSVGKRMKAAKFAIRRYLSAVIEVSRFSAYERLFSLWHVIHVPFVFMLVISGIVHVIAVHMY